MRTSKWLGRAGGRRAEVGEVARAVGIELQVDLGAVDLDLLDVEHPAAQVVERDLHRHQRQPGDRRISRVRPGDHHVAQLDGEREDGEVDAADRDLAVQVLRHPRHRPLERLLAGELALQEEPGAGDGGDQQQEQPEERAHHPAPDAAGAAPSSRHPGLGSARLGRSGVAGLAHAAAPPPPSPSGSRPSEDSASPPQRSLPRRLS